MTISNTSNSSAIALCMSSKTILHNQFRNCWLLGYIYMCDIPSQPRISSAHLIGSLSQFLKILYSNISAQLLNISDHQQTPIEEPPISETMPLTDLWGYPLSGWHLIALRPGQCSSQQWFKGGNLPSSCSSTWIQCMRMLTSPLGPTSRRKK